MEAQSVSNQTCPQTQHGMSTDLEFVYRSNEQYISTHGSRDILWGGCWICGE